MCSLKLQSFCGFTQGFTYGVLVLYCIVVVDW